LSTNWVLSIDELTTDYWLYLACIRYIQCNYNRLQAPYTPHRDHDIQDIIPTDCTHICQRSLSFCCCSIYQDYQYQYDSSIPNEKTSVRSNRIDSLQPWNG
jgi:hypothetical protein